MAIEFRCTSCQQLLRVPDEAVGRTAKCPSCGALVPVVAESHAPSPAVEPDEPQREQPPRLPPRSHLFTDANAASPFAGQPPRDDQADASTNPYSSPTAVAGTADAYSRPYIRLTPTPLELGPTLERAWHIAKENVLQLLLFGLVLMGVQMGIGVVSMLFEALRVAAPNNVPLMISTQSAGFVLQQVLGALVTAVGVKFGLALVRKHPEPIAQAFQVWHVLLRCIGLQIGMMLLSVAIVAAVALPVVGIAAVVPQDLRVVVAVAASVVAIAIAIPLFVYLGTMIYTAMFLIIDEGQRLGQALEESRLFIRGNVLTFIGVWFVTSAVGMLVTLATCCLGGILVYPYMLLTGAVAYLSITGQWHLLPYRDVG